jgi:hypothetical protein
LPATLHYTPKIKSIEMTILKRFLFYSLLALPCFATAQRSCNFKIDTSKILLNENLDKFLSKLQTDRFTTLNDKNAIPKNVKKELDCLTKKFSIANPDQEYACCCTSSGKLPRRKLIFLSKSQDMLVLTYLTGGFGVSTHLLFIQFDNDKIIDLWTGFGSQSLKSNKDIENFIKERRNKEWGLHTNMVYL